MSLRYKGIESMAVPMSAGHSRSEMRTSSPRQTINLSRNNIPTMSIEMPDPGLTMDNGSPPTQDNCDGRHSDDDATITISTTTKLAGQTVAPFLAQHIPQQYAPLGRQKESALTTQKNPNTKYCYRHRPDLKCRRTADEPSMDNLQRVSEALNSSCRLLTMIEPRISIAI
jgi:hypothetical protein